MSFLVFVRQGLNRLFSASRITSVTFLFSFLFFILSHNVFSSDEKVIFSPDFHEGFGKINQSFSGSPDRVVLLFQDAHCNFECQTNLVEILNSVNQVHPLPLICLEGAEGEFETAIFSGFSDRQLNQDLTLHFLKESRITGPEYFVMNGEDGKLTELFGVEKKELYLKSLSLFKEAYEKTSDLNKAFQDLQNSLTQLKSKVYSKPMAELDAIISGYHEGKIVFKDYFQQLLDSAQKHGVDRALYKTINIQNQVFGLERKINFDALEKERSKLIDEVSKNLLPKDVSQLLVQSLQFRMNRISSAGYHNLLKNLADKKQLNLSEFPNIKLYIEYINLISQIMEPVLFDELDKLEKRLKEKTLQSPLAERLEALDWKISFIDRLLHMRISNEDFEFLKNREKDLHWDQIIPGLTKIAEEVKLDLFFSDDLKKLDEAYSVFKAFYQTAIERDQVMVTSALKRMDEKKSSLMVLVTGGFHTRGIANVLKEKGISYFVITPKVTRRNAETPYFSILLNEKKQLDRVLLQGVPLVTQIPLGTAKEPLRNADGVVLRKLVGLLMPAASLANVSQKVEPLELQLAQLKLAADLKSKLDPVLDSLRKLGDNVHIDLSDLTLTGSDRSIAQISYAYKDQAGSQRRGILFLSQSKDAEKTIKAYAQRRGMNQAAQEILPTAQGVMTYMFFEIDPKIADSQSKFRNETLSNHEVGKELIAKNGVVQDAVNMLMTSDLSQPQLALGAIAKAFSLTDTPDVAAAKKYVDALYTAATSESDYHLVATLYQRLLGMNPAPEMNSDIQRRLTVSKGARLALIERGGTFARMNEIKFTEPRALGVLLSLFFDKTEVRDGKFYGTLSPRAGEAVAAFKNMMASLNPDQKNNLRIVLISMEESLQASAFPQVAKEIRSLLGIPDSITSINPIRFVGIQEVKQSLEEADRSSNDKVTQALYNTVAKKAEVKPESVAVMAVSEKELIGHLKNQLLISVGKAAQSQMYSLDDAFTILDEAIRLIGKSSFDPEKNEEDRKYMDALIERLKLNPEEAKAVESRLKGIVKNGVLDQAPEPAKNASVEELNELGLTPEAMLGESA